MFRFQSRRRVAASALSLVIGLLIWLPPVPIVQSAEPAIRLGGAPAAGTGTVSTPPFVRVLDGRTFETTLNDNQASVTLVGIDVAPGNTDCGREAARQLQVLARGGLRLEEDTTIAFDANKHRVYYAITKDGRSVTQELVKAGVARVNTTGEPAHRFPNDEAAAHAAGTGCLWNNDVASRTRSAPKPSAVRATPAAQPSGALPPNFVQETIAAGLDYPTGIVFAPDGRIFVAEKAGLVRIIKNGHLSPYALTNIYQEVNDFGDRGLLGLALDPDFATNHYIYLLYTYENDVNAFDGHKTARLSRFTVGTTGDPDYADPATEKVVLGKTTGTLVGGPPYGTPQGTPMTGSCDDFKPGTDCLPSDNNSHSIGSVVFAPDKTMYVTVGDGASYDVVDDDALRAQNLDLLAGKILHVDRNGKGFSSNWFYTGNTSANRSKVWASGFRNPFRFTFKPGTSTPVIGDVGWTTWEEIDLGVSGGNYGWPCYEGNYVQPGYQDKQTCKDLYARGTGAVTFGLVSWNHNNASAASIGGAFYTGTAFPPPYQGALFFGDYGQSAIRTLTVNSDNTLASGPTDFSTSADGPTQFMMGPDNAMYYVAINAGEVRRILYETNVPVAAASATPANGTAAPLQVQFSSAGSSNPNGNPPSFIWDFGDGSATVTNANPVYTYTTTGTFTVTLTVKDNAGNESQAHTTVTVGNAPNVTILSPKEGDSYIMGTTTGTGYDVSFSGSATEADGTPISSDNLSWKVILHHCQGTSCHVHYLLTNNGTDHGSFTPIQHEDNSYTEIVLTAMSSGGVAASKSVTIQPRKTPITITTNPPGLPIIYGGTSYTAPYTVNAIIGGQRTVEAPSTQDYSFGAWSDGGASQHNIYVNLDTDQNGTPIRTYTAQYTAIPPTITGIAPGSSGTAGGSTVTITGTHLATGGVPTVKFDGVAATNVTAANGNSITAKVPAHPAGRIAVTVKTAGGTATTNFTYVQSHDQPSDPHADAPTSPASPNPQPATKPAMPTIGTATIAPAPLPRG